MTTTAALVPGACRHICRASRRDGGRDLASCDKPPATWQDDTLLRGPCKMPGRPYCMVHDQRSSYRPRTIERSARLVAHGVLTPRMVVGLLIGLPLALIVIYGFWLA